MVSKRLLRVVILYGAVITVFSLIALHVSSSGQFYETVKSRAKDHYNTVSSALNNTLSQNGNSASEHSGSASEVPETESSFAPTVKDEKTIKMLLEKLESPLYDDSIDSAEVFQGNKEIYTSALSTKINEPKVDRLVRAEDKEAGTAKATFLCLVRNEDLGDIVKSIKKLQETFNNDFNYPYTFLNDGEFSEEFKAGIAKVLPAGTKLNFGKIEASDWGMPSFIDRSKYETNMDILSKEGVGHAQQDSYHNMCRYYSKEFYHHPLLRDFKYAWRVEPGVSFYCKLKYDVFKFMEMNNKIYGFTLNLYDNPQSVETLWPTVLEFVKSHPEYLNENGAFEWLKENGQKPKNFEQANGYSTCHFWTNFEITDLDFLRSRVYEEYVDHLDKAGGFYYERWGDAPVRSIALALFANKDSIHWFRDIGYTHPPYTNCPNLDVEKYLSKCQQGKFVPWKNLDIENCQATWINYVMSNQQKGLY